MTIFPIIGTFCSQSAKKNTAFFTLYFFDFREIHPPLSSIEMIMQDGSLKEIDNLEIRKKINKLYKTDLGFILKMFKVKLIRKLNLEVCL